MAKKDKTYIQKRAEMTAITASGRRIKTYVELAVMELQLEANYLLSQIDIEIQQLLMDGYTMPQATNRVIGMLKSEEDFIRSWMNKNKRVIDKLHSNMVAVPIKEYGLKNKKKKFIWSLDGGAKHCGDCEALVGMGPKNIEQWIDVGYDLPRQGGTQCSYGCKCMLVGV